MLNGQSDVIALVDGDGNQLVKYSYDAWGRLLSYELKDETIKVARLYKYNALQYRSYYYDSANQNAEHLVLVRRI